MMNLPAKKRAVPNFDPTTYPQIHCMSDKCCIVVAGPTAVGKTALAVALAQQLGTCIISADSRQCYRELNIGVAKPSAHELAAVPHYFIDTHTISETVTAADFEQQALQAATEVFARHNTVIAVGGTGLYIKAFCEGLDAIPAVGEPLRQEIISGYRQHGLAWLQQQVATADPLWYATGETQNPQRLMRALEVVKATGRSLAHFQQGQKKQRPFRIVKIGLELPRPLLYERINQRVLQMMEMGLEAEVRQLYPQRHRNALQTVGYQELFDHIEGRCSLDEAVARIQQNTRHYAKRQLTWFKKDTDYKWLMPGDGAVEAVLRVIN
jgi:tRNA dimethylallyltransferase